MSDKIDKLNALLNDDITDELDLDFNEEVVEEPIKEKPKAKKQAKKEEPVISETFAALSQSLKKEKVEEKQDVVTTKNILDGIKIDLSSIEIVSGASELDLIKNQNEVLQTDKTMQVVCCQSAYSAEISALRNQEIQNINNVDVDLYNFKKRLYRTLWSHIKNSSVGQMSFSTWMKVTSYFDVETLLYGAYCQTFPYENKYPLTCPKESCKRHFNVVVNNATLIETRGHEKEIYAKIDQVVANVKNSEELLNNSHVHTTKRIALEESKIICDVEIPSVYDYLEGILSKASPQFIEEFETSLGMSIFVKNVFIPDISNYKNTGKLQYIQVDDKAKIINIISNLPLYDGEQLSEDINEFTNRYRIGYSIKNVTCPECGLEFPPIPMNMEDVLFLAIRQGKKD